MIFHLNKFIVDIDVERTRTLYDRPDVPTISEQYDCVNCQNFEKAILKASDPVLAFLRSLGIDPRKPAYAFVGVEKMGEDGNVWYTGWYHVCGHFVEIPETLSELVFCNDLHRDVSPWEQAHTPDPEFPFTVLPVEEIIMLPKAFPTSVVPLQFDTRLPWLMDTPFEA